MVAHLGSAPSPQPVPPPPPDHKAGIRVPYPDRTLSGPSGVRQVIAHQDSSVSKVGEWAGQVDRFRYGRPILLRTGTAIGGPT